MCTRLCFRLGLAFWLSFISQNLFAQTLVETTGPLGSAALYRLANPIPPYDAPDRLVVSPDGRTVAGWETEDWPGDDRHATPFLWRDGQLTVLPRLFVTPGNWGASYDDLVAVANDGTLLIEGEIEMRDPWGDAYESQRLWLYRPNGTVIDAGYPSGFDAVQPKAMSADGRVVVGYAGMWWNEPYTETAFRYRDGTYDLFPAQPFTVGGVTYTFREATATHVADDGTAALGRVEGVAPNGVPRTFLFRWVGSTIEILAPPNDEPDCHLGAAAPHLDLLWLTCWQTASSYNSYWWSPDAGFQTPAERPDLPVLRIGTSISEDLTRIYGVINNPDQTATFGFWTKADGFVSRDAYFQRFGLTEAQFLTLTGSPFFPQDTDSALRVFVDDTWNMPEGDFWILRLTDGDGEPTLTVNDAGDAPDADATDLTCDVDAEREGPQCTLRAALQTAPGFERRVRIVFDLPAGQTVLQPQTALPLIVTPVTLDGSSNPGGRVLLAGDRVATPGASGLAVFGADSVVVRGLAVAGFPEWGLQIEGGVGHVVENTWLGRGLDAGPWLNQRGALYVGRGAEGVTIGGREAAQQNSLYGGLTIDGTTTQRVAVLRNDLAVPEAWVRGRADEPFRLPLDLTTDAQAATEAGAGPSCAPWDRQAALPNAAMPAPRVTALTEGGVAGMTLPGATVVLYYVTGTGTERGRYWATSLFPVATDEADATGAFSITTTLNTGDQIALVAIDADGNTSEPSQLRRPVVYVPGIGGTWLYDAADDRMAWLPLGLSDAELNDRVASLGMTPEGESLRPIRSAGVLEFGGQSVYGPVLQHFQNAGYPGYPENYDPATGGLHLDLWRFANDWRQSPRELADDLAAFIAGLTNAANVGVARACEVDLVTHSNGGVIAAAYVQGRGLPGGRAEAQHRVNRFLTAGTPYLGATQAAAAHTRGYIFGVDESPLGIGWDVDWGRMTAMTRNVEGAYTLLPSRAFWEAMHKDYMDYFLVDLQGNPLMSYDATATFLTNPKTSGPDVPLGMDRNGPMLARMQSDVHALIDDWRTYSGPPQIFRHVGALPASTNLQWTLTPDGPDWLLEDETVRTEAGDTGRHRAYRERLIPQVGWGDGTVPLLSATLGRDARVGSMDFSGVDESPWIEEFEYYGCLHTPLTEPGCTRLGDGVEILDRTMTILRSSYQVPAPTDPRAPGANRVASSVARDVVTVTASQPVRMYVTDAQGRRLGQTGSGSDAMAYEIRGGLFSGSAYGAVVSLPPAAGYTVTVTPTDPGTPSTVTVRRMVADAEEHRTTAWYPSLPTRGVITLALDAPVAEAALTADTDGDRTPDATHPPTETTTGTGVQQPVTREPEAPALPGGFRLSAAYPNPFNPSTQWTLEVTQAETVTVAVYNLLGQRVALLHHGPLAAGTHTLRWDAEALPSGVYVVDVRGTAFRALGRVTLAK